MLQRRQLFMLMASTALSTIDCPGWAATGAPVTPMATAAGQVTIAVSSEFMQDYADAAPLLQTQAMEETYVARDGTLNVYSPVGVNFSGISPVVDRIHASSSSLTGWATQRLPLSPEPIVQEVLFPTLIIAPDPDGDQLMLFKDHGIQIARLGPDGAVGYFRYFQKPRSLPMVHGRLPDSTRYVPEIEVNLSGAISRLLLRDVRTRATYAMDPAAIPTSRGWDRGDMRVILPCADLRDGLYRFVALEETGDVTTNVLALDGNQFVLRDRRVLGKCPSRCLGMREPKPGQVEVYIGNLPDIQLITGTYVPGVQKVGNWAAPITARPRNAPPIPHDARTRLSVTTDPATGEAELTIFIVNVPGSCAPNPNAATARFSDRTGFWDCDGATNDIWLTARRNDGSYDPMVLQDRNTRFIGYFPQNIRNFIGWRPQTGFEIWRRGTSGRFEIEPVRVEQENAAIADSAAYRVGITLTRDGQALASQSLTVESSTICVGRIGLRPAVIGPGHPANAITDPTGTLWVTVQVTNRLEPPTLRVSCPLFGHDVIIDLAQRLQTLLAGVKPNELKAAKDPRSGKPVLTKPQNADAVAGAVNQLMTQSKAKPPSFTLKTAASGNWGHPPPILAPGGPEGVWLVPTSEGAEALRPRPVHDLGAFRLSWDGEDLRFETLPRGILAASGHQFASPNDTVIDASFLSALNPVNWPGAVRDGISKVINLVVDGVKAAVTLVIDGLSYVYNAVLDTLSGVFNALEWVLDQAGVILGTIVGWILEQLGFLFDWAAFKRKRDELRDLVRSQARKIPATLPDPGAAIASASNKLNAYRATAISGLQSFRKTVSGQNFGHYFSSVPSVPALFDSPVGSLLPQVTWLVDKVMSAFPSSRFDLGMPDIPGFASLATDMEQKIGGVSAAIASAGDEFTRLGTTWLSNPTAFIHSPLEPLIDMLIRMIDLLFQITTALLDVVGKALHGMWAKPEAVIDWLDQTIPVPFFSGFYRGLTGNRLSAYDLGCMVAAIPAVLFEKVSPSHKIEMRHGFRQPRHASPIIPVATGAGDHVSDSARDQLAIAEKVFGGANAITTGLDSFFTASLPSNGGTTFTKAVAALNAVTNIGATVCHAWESDPFAESVALSSLMFLGVDLVALALATFDAGRRDKLLQALTCVNANYQIIHFFVTMFLPNANIKTISVDLLSAVQATLAGVVRTGKRPLEPLPYAPPAYAALQVLLVGGRLAIHYA